MVNYSSIFPISTGGGSIAGFEWAERTADFTAEANKAYYCDTALGDILMELPSNPAAGDEVAFLIIGSGKVNITTTDNVKGAALATDFVKQTGQQYLLFVLFFVDSTTGWNWDIRYDPYISSVYIGVGDSLSSYVTLFLKGDGSNGSTNIVDSSASGLTVTRTGSVAISTEQSKIGGSSIKFNGGTDALNIAGNSALSFPGDFCVELWFYYTNAGQTDQALLSLNSYLNGWIIRPFSTSGEIYVNNTIIANFATPSINAWHHLAVVQNGANCYCCLDGVKFANVARSGTVNSAVGGMRIGNPIDANQYSFPFVGYIDSLRITKGVPRYTANFNPETDTFLN